MLRRFLKLLPFKKVEIQSVDNIQIVNPYTVSAGAGPFPFFITSLPLFLDAKGIDYDKLIDQFGCSKITPELLAKSIFPS